MFQLMHECNITTVHNQQKVVPSNVMQKKVWNLHRRPDFVEYGFLTIMIHNWNKNQQFEMGKLTHHNASY